MPPHIAALVALLVFGIGSVAASDIRCPKGTRAASETTPEVSEAWCEAMHNGQTVQHGPYRAWWPNGKRGNSGQYEYGKPVGKWVGWYPSGKLQGEEWFKNGIAVKARYFDERGNQVSEAVKPNLPSQSTPSGAAERKR